MDGGIAVYSSSDLYSWKFENLVIPVFNCSDHPANLTNLGNAANVANVANRDSTDPYPPPSCKNGNGLDLERPKVVRCGDRSNCRMTSF